MLCQLPSNLQPLLQPVSQFPDKTQGVNGIIVADMKKIIWMRDNHVK